jgi:hypothetical protein
MQQHMTEIQIEFDVPAEMRDGTVPRADVYRLGGTDRLAAAEEQLSAPQAPFDHARRRASTATPLHGAANAEAEVMPWAR